MIVYTVISSADYAALTKESEVSPGKSASYRCFADKIYRTFAYKYAYFSGKIGMIMKLNVPYERCMIVRGDHEACIEVESICLGDVEGAEPFLNEPFPGRHSWKGICKIDPAKHLQEMLDAMSEDDKKDGALPTVAILQAGDILMNKYLKGGLYFDPTDAGNLAKAIKDYLDGEYGKQVTNRYEDDSIPAFADAKLIGRKYFRRQAKAAEKEDRNASYEIMSMLGIDMESLHLCPYRGQMDISVGTIGLPAGTHDPNAYCASSSILKDKGILLRYVIQGALYTLRLREKEIEQKYDGVSHNERPVAEMEIRYHGDPIVAVRYINGEFFAKKLSPLTEES